MQQKVLARKIGRRHVEPEGNFLCLDVIRRRSIVPGHWLVD